MPQAFLFDYGGTLDTSARHWAGVLFEGYVHAGVPVSEPHFREAYVYAERKLAREMPIQPHDDFHALLVKKLQAEFEYLVSEQLLPAAHRADVPHYVASIARYLDDFARRQTSRSAQVLQALSSRYRLILVSNFYGNLHTVVERYGLDHYFETIVESAVVGVRKPDPAIWQLGVDAAGCAAVDCVAVGDSYDKDILPARAVGCQTVWFKGEEWKPAERDETLPTHVITSLPQLLHYYPA